ncbi:hypothetical protein FACS1894217_02690 [Clostridia bacterium]|nr:hypothetical protein FACS1894217_02690 [Clostridia bacterium]
MPSINQVIGRGAQIRASQAPDKTLASWLIELDGRLNNEVFGGNGSPPESFPEDMDKPLLVDAPYDKIYDLYLVSRSDFLRQDYVSFQVSDAQFSAAEAEFRRANVRQPSSGKFKGVC